MARRVFKLPDLGEGTVEAEIVQWHVEVGEVVAEDQTLVEVMTDKASVEVPAPMAGEILAKNGEPGDVLAVGSELVVFATEAAEGDDSTSSASRNEARSPTAETQPSPPESSAARSLEGSTSTAAVASKKPLASPAVRRRAKDEGIDLSAVAGSGPKGRIRKSDLDAMIAHGPSGGGQRRTGTEEIKVIGLRRIIAERMTHAVQTIPHFAYVEEVDVTELDRLRRHLNDQGGQRLTYLPFIMLALARALRASPQCNAHYDEQRNVVVRHHGVHIGVATQTADGLKVPVVRHVESLSLQQCAREAAAAAESARDGSARREALTGSTITVTSLGKIGGIVTTPVINAPEVAIIGVNKAVQRPVFADGAVAARLMMNLSSSFDHRFVDGYDAAEMIQAVKGYLEHPATIFMT